MALRMSRFLADRREQPQRGDIPLVDSSPPSTPARASLKRPRPPDMGVTTYSVVTPAPKRRTILRSRIRSASFFDQSSREASELALSSASESATLHEARISTATFDDEWRHRQSVPSRYAADDRMSVDSSALRNNDVGQQATGVFDDHDSSSLNAFDDEGVDHAALGSLSPYREPMRQRHRQISAHREPRQPYDDEDGDYSDKDPVVRRGMVEAAAARQQRSPPRGGDEQRQRRQSGAAERHALDPDFELSVAERRAGFEQQLRAVNVAPPLQQSMYGDSMVRPLDTHVQQSKMQAMGIVMQKLGWPPLNEHDSKEECLWVLQFLENAFRIVDYADEQVALLARINSRQNFDDLDDDASADAEAARDRLANARRGPGSLRDYTFLHTDDDLRRMSPYELCLRRFGLGSLLHAAPREQSSQERQHNANAAELGQRRARDGQFVTVSGEYVDVAYVETITAGMHAYLAMLKRNMLQHFVLMPYQAQQRRIRAIGRALESARAIARHRQRNGLADAMGESDDDDEDTVLVPRHLNQRLQQLHNHVSNMRVMLRSLNQFGSSSARPRGLPLDLLAQGMQDAPTNTQAAIADPKSGEERQEALLMLLQQCYVRNWRRCGDQLYEEVRCNGYSTQAYKQVMSIGELVWKMPNPLTSRAEWIRRTKERGAQKWMEEYLTNAHHDNEMLPDLERSRTQWSFRNGIYTAHDDKFWQYGRTYADQPHCPFNNGTISAKFFDQEFDPDWLTVPPIELKIKSMETIFATQKWSKEVIYWAYVMFGRLFFDVGTRDNWQVAPFFLDMAGTGKSTILEALMHIYDPSAVGTLSNNMEEKFGLMSMYDKNVVFAPEVRNNFRLSQADYQCMVSGERMAIPRKNKEVKEIPRWTAPFAGAGNEAPSWGDAGGALARRFLVFLFNEVVPSDASRPNLRGEILLELPKLILKANRYYKAACLWYRAFNIWSVLPPEFLASRKTIRKATDHVAQFMTDRVRVLESDADECVMLQQFIDAFNAYGHQRQWEKKAIDSDSIVRSLKQTIADLDEEKRKQVRIENRTNANGINEIAIYGIRIVETHNALAVRLSADASVESTPPQQQ